MAYSGTENIMPLLRRIGAGDMGRGGMPVQMMSDEMRNMPQSRLRWMNQDGPMMAGGEDTRGVIQKLRDMITGRKAAIDSATGEGTASTADTSVPAATASEAYTFDHGGKTYHRDANNQLWVLDRQSGQWKPIEGLWED